MDKLDRTRMSGSRTGDRTSLETDTGEQMTARQRWVDRIEKCITMMGIHDGEEIGTYK